MPATIEDQIASYYGQIERQCAVSMRPPALPMDDDALGQADVTAALDAPRHRRRRQAVLLVAAGVGAVVLVGSLIAVLGRQPSPLDPASSRPPTATVTPVATSVAPEPGTVPAVVIPPKQSDNDDRDAVERFLGVPADANEAADWARLAMDQATADCMLVAGFDYGVPQPTQGGVAVGTAAYETALQGPGGCVEQADSRVSFLPAFKAQWAELDLAVRAQPAAIGAATALNECLSANQRPTDSETKIPEACTDQAARSGEIYNDQIEVLAPAWIERHRDALEARREDLADLVTRAQQNERTGDAPPNFANTPFEATGLRVGDPAPTDQTPPGIGPDGEYDPTLVPEWIPVGHRPTGDRLVIAGFVYGPYTTTERPPPGTTDYSKAKIIYNDNGQPIGRFGTDGLPQIQN